MPGMKVSCPDFKRLLDNNRVEFLFDLRNEPDFNSWRVEGHAEIETLNIPQALFVGEEDKYLDRFPRDRRIYIICPHGDAAVYSAEQLNARGFDTVALEGGIDAWSGFYETTVLNLRPDIRQIHRAARGCVAYLVSSEGEAAVIDPARHTGEIAGLAASLGVGIKYVLDTHLHADHVSGGRALAEAVGAAYYINPADTEGAGYAHLPLKDGHEMTIGKSVLKVIHSPGHTPGSTSFLLDGRFLFTGDIIMKESIGRPDLGGKAADWAAQLHDTLFRRLAALPDETVVLPAHSAGIREQDRDNAIKTTLGEARRERDLFRLREPDRFISFVSANLLENPERYQEIRKVNLGLLDADETKKKELEIGKNICGMAK